MKRWCHNSCSLIFLFGLLLMSSPNAETQEEPAELVTDRPDQTESPVVVPPGSVQIETGASYTGDEEDSVDYLGTLLRVGLTRRLELRLATAGWNQVLNEDESPNFGDAELGAKLRLWDENGWRPEVALLLSTSIPIGSDATSTNSPDPAFRFSFAHMLTERLSLGYNVGMAWETTQGDPTRYIRLSTTAPQFSILEREAPEHTLAKLEYTASLGIGITDRLGAFVEVYGDTPLNAHSDTAHALDGGFTYLLRPNVQLDISGGVGLNDAADDWFVGAGLSFRLPR